MHQSLFQQVILTLIEILLVQSSKVSHLEVKIFQELDLKRAAQIT